jgi:hypothetical protein
MTNKRSRVKAVIMIITAFANFNCNKLSKEISKNFNYSSYRVEVSPINSIVTSASPRSALAFNKDGKSFLLEFKGNHCIVVDIEEDSIVCEKFIPLQVSKIYSIYSIDTSLYSLFADDKFIIYKNNGFKEYKLSDFNDEYIPYNYSNIVYYPKENVIVTGALTYNEKLRNDKGVDFNYHFLRVYNLNDLSAKTILFKYPEIFHNNKMGIPKFYLSGYDDELLVSFEYDENIYKININSNNIDTIELKSFNSGISVEFPNNGSKHEKIDAIQRNDILSSGYGMAFFNKTKNEYYRIYRLALPERDGNGYFFSSIDKIYHIIRKENQTDKKYEYKLPGNLFYVPTNWTYNNAQEKIYNKNTLKNDKKGNTRKYNIYRFDLWDFN